jgi:hypothetical protein
MNEENIQKINEISDYFKEQGFQCKREVKTLLDKDSEGISILDNKLNRIDVCCQKDRNIFCAEVEDSQYQCVRNRRALEKARGDWQKQGFNVSTCQLGVNENFKEVCDIPDIEKLITEVKMINPKNKQFKLDGIRLPKKKIYLNW